MISPAYGQLELKEVGKKGVVLFSLQRGLRRFMFSNGDYMGSLVTHLIDSETPPF